ncbi:hypothetical protein Tsubulata_017889 [Turnera subulata]|uniref:AN1-type domain-containing protein n=1 Tax=Turnera subulata TaxID=218843 RepID=A0A9Q0G3H2_9ROSI|nr:hypothetical protein Tsubulata_017889 [Turnera subulata]
MNSGDNSSSTPPLCARGCGFYGSTETRSMCSKCYNDYLKQELIAKSSTNILASTPAAAANYQVSPTPSITADFAEKASIDNITPPPPPAINIKNRCEGCNKKVGLTGFACRCGKVFCGKHRYPKEHSCTFDFKALDRVLLVKQNPLVQADKLDARV